MWLRKTSNSFIRIKYYYYYYYFYYYYFNLAKPRAPFCLIQVHCLSECPILCCAQPGYALVFEFWSFFTLNQFTVICLSVGSLTCHQPIRFSFRDFTSFFEILRDLRYFIIPLAVISFKHNFPDSKSQFVAAELLICARMRSIVFFY